VKVPYYLEVLLNKNFFKKNDKNQIFTALNKDEVDEDIVEELFKLNLNLDRNNIEDIKKSIKQRRNVDFCVIYDFLSHQKFIDKCFNKTVSAQKVSSFKKKSSQIYSMENMFEEEKEESLP